MPKTIDELATMISKRDGISVRDALALIRDTAAELEQTFFDGNVDEAENILRYNLGLEPDYLDLFIY